MAERSYYPTSWGGVHKPTDMDRAKAQYDARQEALDAAYQASEVGTYETQNAAWNDGLAANDRLFEHEIDGADLAAAVVYGRFLRHMDVLAGLIEA